MKVCVNSAVWLVMLIFCSCSFKASERKALSLVDEWIGQEIKFPMNLPSLRVSEDSVDHQELDAVQYKIVSYVDSLDCLSCKVRLYAWNVLMRDLKNRSFPSVPIFMFFCPKNQDRQELSRLIEENDFGRYSYLDVNDSLNKLNHFPSDMAFQTFLLDKDNKVLAIGNPVLNPKVKELYLRIIRGDAPSASSRAVTPTTTVSFDTTLVDLGHFPWQEPQSFTFTLKNTGDRPLVIRDVVSSCGCVEVEYPEEPVRAGHERELRVRYRAKSRGPVSQSMLVYSNAEKSPVRLYVRGKAE